MQTKNVGLKLTSQNGDGLSFSEWRAMINGSGNDSNMELIDEAFGRKGDNLEFDNEEGLLYLTSGGERIGDGIKVATSGGGGGGGGSNNNAVISLSNKSGWIYKTVASGSPCPIEFEWSSLEEGLETGPGVLKITVNSSVKATMEIKQGYQLIDIWPWLDIGLCNVKVNVTDTYGNSRTLNLNVTSVSLTIESSFDSSLAYSGATLFTYTPTGYAEKTVYFIMDGKQIGEATISTSGRQQSFIIPAQSHGAHTFEVYFNATIDKDTIPSNRLRYRMICIEEGNNTPVIAMSYWSTTVEQFALINIDYVVYDPSRLLADITLSANGKQVGGNLTVNRAQQIWSYRPEKNGELELSIRCGDSVDTISFFVSPNSLNVEAETEALALYLNAYGRSNNENDPSTWVSGNVASNLTGFNFVSDGWQLDDNGATVLRVGGQARVEIPYKIFKDDCRSTGKTIEIEFATRDVMNYDTPIITCYSGGRGLNITAQKAVMKSEQSAVDTQFKENEHVRLAFVVEKNNAHRLLMIYINGIMSGAVQYPADDDFSQLDPVGISIGSSECTVDVYCIRVYDNDLTRYQVLDNWIADTTSLTEKAERYQRNDIYDDYGKIVISKLPEDLPYMVMTAPVLPQYKGNKVTVRGSYTDLVNVSKSYTFEGAEADVQGTSSAGYARKNYKVKFKGGFIRGGVAADEYQLGNSVPTKTFTFKADVASSEGANNVELVKLYNDICPYKTPPQLLDARVRQGIDGYPMVIFHDNGESVTFVGKYNYNHDKGTPEVFGLDDNDESWETKNNTGARALWKSADFSGSDWENDFEARHPDKNTNTTKLAALAAWLVSTDTEQATGEDLAEAVTYDSVEYTADTAEYRLAKFSAELGGWFNETSTIFYYLFTELFLMTDSRTKNSFPTLYDNGVWCWLPYDMDTAIGINNMGALTFGYSLEDIDLVGGEPVYNGQNSVLWKNLRATRYEEIKAMYQQLRSDKLLTYEDVVARFDNHQAKWPEAIFNEDAYYKYLQPLFEGTGDYLGMLQGSKAEQRKWWLYNRFQYMDSKYLAGDSQITANTITVRGYNKSNITITPYADVYSSVKFGSYLLTKRALRGNSYTFEYPMDTAKETETYIYSANQIADVGDLSGYKVGYADFAAGARLQRIKLGDAADDYRNEMLNALYLGKNTLLKTLDVRNCPNLGTAEQQSVDISGCANIEEVYFTGTSIAGVTLPNGGVIKKLHLPGTLANLTVRNHPLLEDFYLADASNLSTLRVENSGSAIPINDLLMRMQNGSRVRLIGMKLNLDSGDELENLKARLDKMRGLDENGNNVDKPQVSGDIWVDNIVEYQYNSFVGAYPEVTVHCDAFTTYTVSFYNGGVLTRVASNIKHGGTAYYSGNTPVMQGVDDPENYTFIGWYPVPKYVERDMSVSAVHRRKGINVLEMIDGTISGEYVNDRITKLRDYAMHRCGNLTGVTLSNATHIGEYALGYAGTSGCVNLPNAETIAKYAMHRSGFTEVRAPKATSDWASFYGMPVTLVDVYSFVSDSFVAVKTLETLIIRRTDAVNPMFIYLKESPVGTGAGKIYVPATMVNAYKAHSDWSAVADSIFAIEDYPEITGG